MTEIEHRIEYIPLQDVIKWDRNPKDHDIGLLAQSFDRFGFIVPILMDEKSGKLVAGHGRLDTLLMYYRKKKDPPIGIKLDGVDWLVPVIRGVSFENEVEAEAFLLTDNRSTEQGGWLDNLLAPILQDHALNLTGTGFDKDDIDRLLEDLYEVDKHLEKEEPENEISPELFERYDYIVLLFENEIDWQRAVEVFGIETVSTSAVGGKSEEFAMQQKGLGRVIMGKDLFAIIDRYRDA